MGDLVGREEVGRTWGVVLRVLSLEEPAGGAPVAVGLGGLADGAEEFDFEVGFGLGELVGKGGISCGGAGDGAGGAADVAGGDAAAASEGEKGEDPAALVAIEDWRAAGTGVGLVDGKRGRCGVLLGRIGGG